MSISDAATTRWTRRAAGTLAATAMIAAGFVALAGPASAAGNTIFVDPQGTDNATCGVAVNQCKTITKGLSRAADGDTVSVAAGNYNEIVDITKGITLKGASGAVIDGTGLTTPNGLVNITQPTGDVTLTGFTIQNQVAPGGGNDDSYGVTINDSTAAHTITVSDNMFPALSPARPDENPYGVNSANTLATQVISNNIFGGLWRGVLLEGNNGPVTVSNNIFDGLIPVPTGDDDGSMFPPKAVYILADGNEAVTDQNINGNTFRNFAGIGLSIRAGYDLGGCVERICDGSVTASANNNTFQLDTQPSNNSTRENQQNAAFNVQSLFEGDKANLTISGNTGTVSGQPIIEPAGDGTTTVTPGASPNTIAPDPAPTVALTLPSALVSGDTARNGNVAVTNNSSTALSNLRYRVTIKGANGIKASQLKLQSNPNPGSSTTFTDVTLTDDTSNGTVTGLFGPSAGFSLASSATAVTNLRLSVTDSAVASDTLTTTIDLVQVASSSAHPVIDNLKTSNAATTTVSAPAQAPVSTVTPVLGTLAKAFAQQTVTITVVNSDNTKPSGLEVDVLVSGATVANGTVTTNANGVATFTFTTQHKGAFTVKAIAGGKSASVSGTTPIRNVSTSVGLASPAKGTIKAVAYTSPKASGAIIAFYFVQNGKYVFFHNAKADANGIATITATGRVSGGTYSMAARVVNDPDTDSVYSPTKSIKIR